MGEVYILLADGFEEVEAIFPYDLLYRAGSEVCLVSITDDKTVRGKCGLTVTADLEISRIQDEGDMLVLPGGAPGYINLRESGKVRALITKTAEQRRYIAAICAAPTILGGLGLLTGLVATCYPGMEGELSGAVLSDDEVCVSGKIITAKSAGAAKAFALTLVEVLHGKAQADKIKSEIY